MHVSSNSQLYIYHKFEVPLLYMFQAIDKRLTQPWGLCEKADDDFNQKHNAWAYNNDNTEYNLEVCKLPFPW